MTVTSVTPTPGLAIEVTTGGTPVNVVPANPNGGFITNPYTAAYPLIVNPVSAAGTSAGGSNFALQPGQSWSVIPGQSTVTSVNSTDSAHQFSAIYW